jgi:hypothetical protein
MSTPTKCFSLDGEHDYDLKLEDGKPVNEFCQWMGVEFEYIECRICQSLAIRPSGRWMELATVAREMTWGYLPPAYSECLKELMVEAGMEKP